ncbi:MAG: hypothetical protein P4L10_12530 [Acidobacteriaceae bacterium]|nr:hypothetical protein [Acidobacteriaceae bacterium]
MTNSRAGHPGFEPLQDCCCMNPPRVLRRYVASMAFNFSAVPERVALSSESPIVDRNPGSHRLLRFFSHANFPAAS